MRRQARSTRLPLFRGNPGPALFFATWLAAGCLFPRAGAAQPWYEDYDQAVDLIGQSERAARAGQAERAQKGFEGATTLLNRALVIRSVPMLHMVTYGVANFVNYLPFYQLGRAAEGLGQFDRASEYYRLSLARGAIRESSFLGDLQQRLGRIEIKLQATPTPSRVELAEAALEAGDLQAVATLLETLSGPEADALKRRLEVLRPTLTPTTTPSPRPTPLPPSPTSIPPKPRPTRPAWTPTPPPPPTPTRTIPPTATTVPTATSTATPTAEIDARYNQSKPGLFLLQFKAFHPAGVARVELHTGLEGSQQQLAFNFAWEPDEPDQLPLHFRGEGSFDLGVGIHNAEVRLLGSDGSRLVDRQVLGAFPSRLPPLPWLITAAGFLIATPVWLLRRRRRRTGALARNFNPYIAGAPVLDDDMFFGRRDLLEQLLSTLHNNSLLLHGERRIGKTSLLHSLHRHLSAIDDPNYRFFPVFIDLEGTPEDEFFALVVAEILHHLERELEGVELRYPNRRHGESYGGNDFAHDLRLIIRTLKRLDEKSPKLVLLLDEVDALNHYSARTNQRLRSLFMKTYARHLGLVMAGVGIKKQWDSEGSPWYNFFEEVPVRPLHPNEARDLILEPVRGIFSFDEEVVQTIIELAGGRPYLIQRCCIACVNRVTARGQTTIRRSDLDAVVADVLGSDS